MSIFNPPHYDIPQNSRGNIRCIVCGKNLSGGLDTFGPERAERCESDYLNDAYPQAASDELKDRFQRIQTIVDQNVNVDNVSSYDRRLIDDHQKRIRDLYQAFPSLDQVHSRPIWTYGKGQINLLEE